MLSSSKESSKIEERFAQEGTKPARSGLSVGKNTILSMHWHRQWCKKAFDVRAVAANGYVLVMNMFLKQEVDCCIKY
jgi:hypothetical protein